MSYTETNGLQKNSHSEQTPPAERNTAKMLISDFSPIQIKEAFNPEKEVVSPLEELIATGEAVFEFIRNSKMDLSTRNAFSQLEKQFEFHKNLLLL